MYAAGATWLFVTAYPTFLLAGSGSFVGALVGQMLLAAGVAIYSSALLVGLVELFPTALRCRGHGISYNVAVAVFGGTTRSSRPPSSRRRAVPLRPRSTRWR